MPTRPQETPRVEGNMDMNRRKFGRIFGLGALAALAGVATGCPGPDGPNTCHNPNDPTCTTVMPDSGPVVRQDGMTQEPDMGVTPGPDMQGSDTFQPAPDQKVEKVKPAPTLDTNTIKIDTGGYPLSSGGKEYPFSFEAKNADTWAATVTMVTKNPDGGTIKYYPGTITPASGGMANNTVDKPVTYKSGNGSSTDVKITITVNGPGGDLTVDKTFRLN